MAVGDSGIIDWQNHLGMLGFWLGTGSFPWGDGKNAEVSGLLLERG